MATIRKVPVAIEKLLLLCVSVMLETCQALACAYMIVPRSRWSIWITWQLAPFYILFFKVCAHWAITSLSWVDMMAPTSWTRWSAMMWKLIRGALLPPWGTDAVLWESLHCMDASMYWVSSETWNKAFWKRSTIRFLQITFKLLYWCSKLYVSLPVYSHGMWAAVHLGHLHFHTF